MQALYLDPEHCYLLCDECLTVLYSLLKLQSVTVALSCVNYEMPLYILAYICLQIVQYICVLLGYL